MEANKKPADTIAADLVDAAELGVTVDARLIKAPLPNYAPTSKAPRPGRHARKSFKKTAVRPGFNRRRSKKIQW
jgi:hypothetical protein